jgi:hypothetical protein
MADHSIIVEHTLVLAGDTVDMGSVWQGWPSHTHIPLEIHRKNMTYKLDKETFEEQKKLNENHESNMQRKLARAQDLKAQHLHDAHAERRVSFTESGGYQSISHPSASGVDVDTSFNISRPPKKRTVSYDESSSSGERTPLLSK